MATKKLLSTIGQLTEEGDGALKPENVKMSSEKATNAETGGALNEAKPPVKRGRVKRRKAESFKCSLESILSLVVDPNTIPQAVRSTPLGDNITYQEAILIAQVLKAASGDTQAANFIRDTSGNKLKEKEDRPKIKLEDLI